MRFHVRKTLCFVLVVASSASHALIVKLSDLHTMAKRSDLVVHGYVGEQRVVHDELGRLITLSDVEVVDGLHGAKSGEIITIYQVGGEKDGVVMPLMGGQRYGVGEQIFFFGLQVDDAYVSYGAGQGKLDIRHNVNEDVVVEDLGDVSTMIGSGSHAAVTRPMPLYFNNAELFKDEVKLMLQHR